MVKPRRFKYYNLANTKVQKADVVFYTVLSFYDSSTFFFANEFSLKSSKHSRKHSKVRKKTQDMSHLPKQRLCNCEIKFKTENKEIT